MSIYRIEMKPMAIRRMRAIASDYDLNAIIRRIGELTTAPDLARELKGNLSPIRSAHAARDRYRILFTVAESPPIVHIQLIGRRIPGCPDDVYAEMERLLLDDPGYLNRKADYDAPA